MARVGIEIPNGQVATVGLREVIESGAFQSSKAKLPMPLGRVRYSLGEPRRSLIHAKAQRREEVALPGGVSRPLNGRAGENVEAGGPLARRAHHLRAFAPSREPTLLFSAPSAAPREQTSSLPPTHPLIGAHS